MKKIVVALLSIGILAWVWSPSANAASVVSINGNQSGGWYKDGYVIQLKFGNGMCRPTGTMALYASTSANEGSHHYQLYADSFDNPYMSVDGTLSPVVTPCYPTSGTTSYTPPALQQDIGTLNLDSQAPAVSITNPSGGSTITTGTSYLVSGPASDVGSGLKYVQAIVNGVDGPKATLSGSTFSVGVTLKSGSNSVQMVAFDNVGHSTNSNTVTIYSSSTTTGSGSTGSTTNTSESSSSTTSGSSVSNNPNSIASSSNSTKNNDSSSSSKPQTVKFNQQQILNIKDSTDSTSDPTDVQATAALAGATGKTYDALILTIIILFLLCAFVLWRFRPVFAELDRNKSGLRRRIIVIVTLPSLLPLLGLGFIGYQQLSNSVKNTLSSQLEKAAQTSALKLDREFNIRRTIITKTSSDILQIKAQYQDQRETLSKQKDSCSAVVKANIPKGQYSAVTNNDNCLPFLTGFAQLASSTGAKVDNYQSALDQGATQAQKDLTAQEDQRVDELLGSLRHFFPDILELDILDASKEATIKATLPRSDSKQSNLQTSHADLLKQSSSDYLALFDNSSNTHQLILTYPVNNGNQTLGGVVVAYDTQNKNFVPNIWSSTPKPYAADQVYFVTTAGELVAPKEGHKELNSQLKTLASTSSGKVYELRLASQKLATRTSPVPNTNWIVAVGAPSSSILAPLAGIQRTALLAIVGFILLSVLLGIWFVSSIAGEIERLFRGALAFAKNDLDYRIDLKSHDELQILGQTMNKMADDIKEAQNALIEKDKEFINVATHELKAPMTSIIGNLSMIRDDGMGQVDETARKLIDQAYTGTIRLRDIVTDMLDIARLESGHAQLNLESVSIRDITEAVVQMQSVPAIQTNIFLQYQPAADLPNVIADKNKLQIIITNFVSNAIKYNRSGGSVTVSHKIDGDKLVTSVADTGLGIPDDQQAHMFEKFFRVQHEDRSNVPGTGLGLHITKRFIEAMGGQVWFESVHGQGTTFYFSLPVASPPAASPEPIVATSETLQAAPNS